MNLTYKSRIACSCRNCLRIGFGNHKLSVRYGKRVDQNRLGLLTGDNDVGNSIPLHASVIVVKLVGLHRIVTLCLGHPASYHDIYNKDEKKEEKRKSNSDKDHRIYRGLIRLYHGRNEGFVLYGRNARNKSVYREVVGSEGDHISALTGEVRGNDHIVTALANRHDLYVSGGHADRNLDRNQEGGVAAVGRLVAIRIHEGDVVCGGKIELHTVTVKNAVAEIALLRNGKAVADQSVVLIYDLDIDTVLVVDKFVGSGDAGIVVIGKSDAPLYARRKADGAIVDLGIEIGKRILGTVVYDDEPVKGNGILAELICRAYGAFRILGNYLVASGEALEAGELHAEGLTVIDVLFCIGPSHEAVIELRLLYGVTDLYLGITGDNVILARSREPHGHGVVTGTNGGKVTDDRLDSHTLGNTLCRAEIGSVYGAVVGVTVLAEGDAVNGERLGTYRNGDLLGADAADAGAVGEGYATVVNTAVGNVTKIKCGSAVNRYDRPLAVNQLIPLEACSCVDIGIGNAVVDNGGVYTVDLTVELKGEIVHIDLSGGYDLPSEAVVVFTVVKHVVIGIGDASNRVVRACYGSLVTGDGKLITVETGVNVYLTAGEQECALGGPKTVCERKYLLIDDPVEAD